MIPVLNDIDRMLQDAPTRFAEVYDRALLLTCSSPGGFKVSTSGTPTPSAIDFSPIPLGMPGAVVTYTLTGGLSLTYNGNNATLNYSGMPAGTGTVQAHTTFEGVTHHSAPITINKVFDGSSGTGTAGQRGAGSFYVVGSSWSDVVADMATPGETMLDDVVTISNGTSFVAVKRWNGSAWVAQSIVIDGGLVVPGTITANQINANGLVIRAPDGTPLVGIGVPLDPSLAAPGTKNSDLNIGLGTGNKIVNSGPYRDSLGSFYVGYNTTGLIPEFQPSGDPYRPAGNGGVYISFPGTPSGSCDINDAVRPVVGGKRYEFSVYVGPHRCDATIFCYWFKADGSQSSTPYSDGSIVGQYGASGAALAGWPRATMFATAPADAATVRLATRMLCNGGANPYLFASMWYIGAALPAQTVASEWSDGASGTAALIDAAAAQETANGAANAIPGINSAIADKLSKTGNEEIYGQKSLMSQYALLVGTVNDGIIYGSTGLYGRNGGYTMFSIGANGRAIFADQLMAAWGTFGSVSIAVGGKLTLGAATNFGDEGVFLGYVGATAKFSIVTGSSKLLYDPIAANPLQLINAGLTNPNNFSINAGADINSSGGGTGRNLGTRTVAINGGEGQKIIRWAVTGVSGGIVKLTGETTATVGITVSGGTNPGEISGEISCTVTDASGFSKVDSFNINVIFF